jgi:hypothetical protein
MIEDFNTTIKNQVESVRDLEMSNTYIKNELKEAIFLVQEL